MSVITAARLVGQPHDGTQAVVVHFDGNEEPHTLFTFYPDEIAFTAREFLGLTKTEGLHLFYERDLAYLRAT